MTCERCGVALSFNEIGLGRKFGCGPLCLDCQAARLGVTRERLLEKIEEFRRAGCRLFTTEKEDG